MDKRILEDYMDACALVRETEQDIRRLEQRKTTVHDSVKGSMHEFPYAPQSFHLEGTREGPEDRRILEEKRRILCERKAGAERIKLQVEEWMLKIPMRMQRIIRFRYFEKMSWEEVAVQIGGKATADSVKMELRRFLEKN